MFNKEDFGIYSEQLRKLEPDHKENLEDILVKTLSDELSKSINEEILKEVMNLGNNNKYNSKYINTDRHNYKKF